LLDIGFVLFKGYLMRNFFLLFLTIANAATAFGVAIEKDSIVVEYKKCVKYKGIKEDPYCIAIKNGSTHPIIANQKLISVPLDSYEELLQIINDKYNNMQSDALIFAFLMGGAAYISGYFYQAAQARAARIARLASRNPGTQIVDENLDRSFAYVMGGLAICCGIRSIISIWKATQLRAIKNKLFHQEMVIQPGQLVEKIFWLKDPKAQFEINVDMIKVLK
jgi:hypothetical protein